MVIGNQNYSFIEKDPLLFNSAKILALVELVPSQSKIRKTIFDYS